VIRFTSLRRRAGPLVAALTLAAGLASGCQGVPASAGSAAGRQVTVRALDTMRFDPATVTVPAGQPVQLTLKNDGALIHDFVLSDGVAAPFKVEANGKASANATLTVLQPGTYTYVCAQPGHEAAGMKGTLVAR
jgi:plastocyanin